MKLARAPKSVAGRIVLWLLPAVVVSSVLALFVALRPGTARAQEQDADGDGMPDAWEATFGLDPDDPSDAALDADADGLSNLQEYLAGTYPVSADSDGDGLLDPWEITHEINPLSGLRADLAGWWRFTEESGTAVTDWSGRGRDAEILAPEHVSRVTGAPVGGALRFDGVSDDDYLGLGGYVRVSALTNAPLASGFTAAAWVRADSFADVAIILAKTSDHDAWSDGFTLSSDGATPSGHVRQWEVAANRVSSGPTATNQWLHLCMVYDGDYTSFYANGVLTAIATNAAGGVANADALWIGSIYGGGDGFPLHGDIADVRLYTGVLDAEAVADLLDTYADPDGDGLVNLDEQTAGTDPNNPDSDGDGLPDGWEVAHGLDPLNASDASLDPDGDDLANLQEYQHGSNPLSSDSDGDGMPDAWEAAHGLDPAVANAAADTDGDGVANLDEYRQGRDPRTAAVSNAAGQLNLRILTPME